MISKDIMKKMMESDIEYDGCIGTPITEIQLDSFVSDDFIAVASNELPVEIMRERGWFEELANKNDENYKNIISEFFSLTPNVYGNAIFYRHSYHQRTDKKINEFILAAWTTRIILLSEKQKNKIEYKAECISEKFIRELVSCSVDAKGPLIAKSLLSEVGIEVIVEPKLPGADLDGCAMLTSDGVPVIGMTLRHDRVDNFWFTLLHELAHIYLHLKGSEDMFFDNFDDSGSVSDLEIEADRMAGEMLVTKKGWKGSKAEKHKTKAAVIEHAKRLGVNPAIVAGKIRYENSFAILSDLVGQGEVRKLFKL